MKEFLEERIQLLQTQGESIENLRQKMKNTTHFEVYSNSYVKLVNEVSLFSESYRILVDELLDTMYNICIQTNLVNWPEIISNVKIDNKIYKLDETVIKNHIEIVYKDILDTTNFELSKEFIQFGNYQRDMEILYELAEEMIRLQGHPLTLEDLHYAFEDTDVYKRLPNVKADEVLMKLADLEIPSDGYDISADSDIEGKKIESVNDFDEGIIVNDKKHDLRELPELIQPGFKKYYEILKTSCKDLESNFNQITKLGLDLLKEKYEQRKKFLKEIDEKLKESPPPTISDFQKELTELAKIHTIISGLKKWDLNPKLFTVLKNHYFGQDKEEEIYDYRFYDISVRIPWKFRESYKIEDEELEQLFKLQNQEFKGIIGRIKKIKILERKSHVILKQLEQMDPEFQVFLPRLAELVDMQVKETEEILVYVLQKHPQIGKYDEMSQMLKFSKPDDVSELIDKLLKKYEETIEKKE